MVFFVTCSVQAKQPNILLLVAEDMGPRVGVFGDPLAYTPNLDDLAKRGVRFPNTFTTSGVCAPSRAALITGMHQNSSGAGHMRTQSSHWPMQYQAVPDPEVKAFPELLRRAGYYTFTDRKLDYQFSGPMSGSGPPTIWDAQGVNDRWRGRSDGQPFFGLINFMITHESAMFRDEDITPRMRSMRRQMNGNRVGKGIEVSPEAVPVPPFLPDLPEVRQDIATHYKNISIMDAQVGEIMEALADDGLLESTIIIWTADNGDGLPRHKREIFDTGIRVPLIVHWPDALKPADVDPGMVAPQLVSFVDIAPTILEMADIAVPQFVHGVSFLHNQRAFVFAARDRMDSAEDRQRAVRDHRFKYIRTYYPERPGYMDLAFRNQLRTMRVWREAFDAGRLNDVQAAWFRARPREALYDTRLDPFETRNLAQDPRHLDTLKVLRRALDDWQARVPDLGAIPEQELFSQFRPDGKQPVTSPPEFSWDESSGVLTIRASGGASVRYRIGNEAWRVYGGAVVSSPGEKIIARAVRYGWQESADSIFVAGAPGNGTPGK